MIERVRKNSRKDHSLNQIAARLACFAAMNLICVASAAPLLPSASQMVYAYPIERVVSNLCVPHGINDSGQVVGDNYLKPDGARTVGFVTGPNGLGVKELRVAAFYTSATGINNSGQVVGYAYGASAHVLAFITDPGGANIRTVGPEGASATGINDLGQVSGAFSRNGIIRGFFTGPDGKGHTLLGTLGGLNSVALYINPLGEIAGRSSVGADGTTLNHAFVTGPNGVGMTDLGLPGSTYSEVTGINTLGEVSGYQIDQNNVRQAYVTGPDGVGIKLLGSLGNLPGGLSEGGGINDAGLIVGDSTRGADYFHLRVTLTGPDGRMHNLNRYIANLPPGVQLRNNAVINNLNQIAATGSDGQCYIVCPNQDCKKPVR